MLLQSLAILVPLIFSVVLRNSLEHDNVLIDNFGHKTPSRVLLVTAHPDDETMFFAPTLLGLLSHPKEVVEVYSLCLSTGDADGLGLTRPNELARALGVLGVDDDKHWVANHPNLKDNFTATWDPQVIAAVVEPYISQNAITTILTFDQGGISGHPNHASIQQGIIRLIHSPERSGFSPTPTPRLFTLISLPAFGKYQGPLAPLLAKYDLALQHLWHTTYTFFLGLPKDSTEAPHMPVFVSSIRDYRVALRAMYEHWSQLVWFRWLYVGASRYMWVNEWVEVVAPRPRRVSSK
ncbi:LmbE-like protein [Athelia psychrophila]|uniref:N-acetylglucosaminylphosphatidylinositol deacetylase n=1 Tax=Athelia psychrophila TaxID=1759441 RepID=A0A166NHZ9_9AGAM|nr:LmbE-like protein [Fibularhizoctonia sp. CBS 109695]